MFNRPETIPSETGTEFDKTYMMKYDDQGNKVLLCTGKTNRYEEIQSHLEETQIENILARATLDPSVLEQKIGQYVDTTNMPKTLVEAQNTMLALKYEFESLPAEIRYKFDGSLDKYMANYGTEEWATKIGLIKEVAAEPTATPTEEGGNE